MTLSQLLTVLKARWKIVLVVMTSVFVLAILFVSLYPKQYSATVSMVVDTRATDTFTGAILPQVVQTSVIATQLDIIRSEAVSKSVVKELKLDLNPDVIRLWRESGETETPIADWMAALLRRKLDAQPSREGNVIYVTYTANNPAFAAAVANAYAAAYSDVSVRLKAGPARRYSEFFETQAKVARERLEAAQAKLAAYQKEQGIATLDDRLDYESAKLSETSSQITAMQALTTDSASKRMQGRSDTIADVMQNPVVSQLKAQIAAAEGKLSQTAAVLGEAHPSYKSAAAEISELKQKLDMEVRKINASIDTAYQVGRQREAQLQSALAAQKSKVLQLTQQKNELNVLKRDVESAQRAYDMILSRADQTGVESQLNHTNISVLSQATPSTKATFPKPLQTLVFGMVLGLGLGVFIAVFVELKNKVIRSHDDVPQYLGLPLLGQVSNANKLIAN